MQKPINGLKGIAVDDSEPTNYSCTNDFVLLDRFFNRELPLLVLNCGSGENASLLNDLFDKVIAVDKRPSTVRHAKKRFEKPGLEFQTLDVLDGYEVRQLKEKTGDLNIYFCGSLQQVLVQERPKFIEHLKFLIGNRGTLYFLELSPNTATYLENLHHELGTVDPGVNDALAKRVTELVGVSKMELRKAFSRRLFKLLEFKSKKVTLHLRQHRTAEVPVNYVVVRGK